MPTNNSPKTCSIKGCKENHIARGYCGTHYKRWQTHGDANIVKRDVEFPKKYPKGRTKFNIEYYRAEKLKNYARKKKKPYSTMLDSIIDFFFKHHDL